MPFHTCPPLTRSPPLLPSRVRVQLLKKCEGNVKKIAIVGNTGRLSQQERVRAHCRAQPPCPVYALLSGPRPHRRCGASPQTVRLNVMRSLATELQSHSKTFRTAQKDFLKRRTPQHAPQHAPLGVPLHCPPPSLSRPPSHSDSVLGCVALHVACGVVWCAELREQETSGGTFGFGDDGDSKAVLGDEDALDRGFSAEQEQALEHMNERASEREKEIIKVAQSINELAQLFKELNVLVLEQGTILDRIDYNIEQTVTKVKQGVTELEKADEYSKKMYDTTHAHTYMGGGGK